MKAKLTTTLLLLCGLFCFDHLFWKQDPGINLFLFSLLLLSYAFVKSRELIKQKEVLLATTSVLISGFMVVWHNTGFSIFMHVVSMLICLGFIKQAELKSTFESLIGFLASYFTLPLSWFKSLRKQKESNAALGFLYSFIKLGLLPLILFGLFFIIYRNASPKFEELTHSFAVWFGELFKDFSFGRMIFILFGFSLLSMVFFKSAIQIQSFFTKSDSLKREKKAYAKTTTMLPSTNLYADLVNEYKIALIVFSLLNALLLVVNVLDINWIWFDFEVPLEFNLKQFVHEGTYLLIFSILLSIVVFLYFFRSSLNFYPKNKWLLLVGKLWIIQNIILAVSVFLRNYHYISYHGLAGKRIGVIAFLTMTIFGLITLIIKVNKLKSFGYLVRKNGWFVLIILSLLTCLNWDRVIVNYNLSHANTGEIDVDYYLNLSPRVSPIILKNLNLVEAQMEAHKNRVGKEIWLSHLDIELFKETLEYNTSQYILRRKKLDWPSWSYADAKLFSIIKLEKN